MPPSGLAWVSGSLARLCTSPRGGFLDCLRDWGDHATKFATQLLDGRAVTLQRDPLTGERDFYGRLLAYIHLNGEDFNVPLLELGYARVYTEGG